MSELKRIKSKIFEEDRIREVLELLECDSIDTEQRGELFTASLPDGDNPRSVQVKNNANLTANIRSRGIDGDIYDLVSYIVYEAESKDELSKHLHKSKYWLCEKLGYLEFIDDFYKETSGEVEVPKYNDWLKKIPPTNKQKEIPRNTVVCDKKLEEFGLYPYTGWLKEGISYRTQQYFGVGIDVKSERITFPIHNKDGELIGVKGRYCGRNKEIEGMYKYIYILPCNKSYEFFNLFRAMPYIEEKKEVIIVEGAKTVMLLTQWGYKNVISIEGDSLSGVQIELLKDLGLDVKYVFMWDKDKTVEFIHTEVSRLQGRMRYAMVDKEGLLQGKDSPCDYGKEVFEKLYRESIYKIK